MLPMSSMESMTYAQRALSESIFSSVDNVEGDLMTDASTAACS